MNSRDMLKLKNRKSKVAFLKGLVKGERSISELASKQIRINVWLYDNEKKTYYCKMLKKEFTEKEYDKYQKRREKKYKNHISDIMIHRTIVANTDVQKRD
jgi:hypothetical protein